MKRHYTSALSQLFGRFASKAFSPSIQGFINSSYVKLMKLDMHEFRNPKTYTSLNALFTRTLETPRHFSLDAEDFISPCDALVSECGELNGDKALQIKGMPYYIDDLLTDAIDSQNRRALKNGTFLNLYLSPRDYHRYHIPMNLKIKKAVHVPGKLYPVNMPSLKSRLDLFIENERVIVECENHAGDLLYLILVGALNVGKMQVNFAPQLQTNANTTAVQSYEFEDLYLNKGEDFGCFEMGSTIVVIARKGMMRLSVEAGEKVSFGQNVAKVTP